MQERLDKTKPYATNIGELINGIMYEQNGIGFDHNGNRVTPVTQPELEAKKEKISAERKLYEAEKIRDAAVRNARDILEAQAIREPQPEKVLPEGFDTWTREDIINYARNKFNIELKGTLATVRARLKAML